jgi:hypothetical protein
MNFKLTNFFGEFYMIISLSVEMGKPLYPKNYVKLSLLFLNKHFQQFFQFDIFKLILITLLK